MQKPIDVDVDVQRHVIFFLSHSTDNEVTYTIRWLQRHVTYSFLGHIYTTTLCEFCFGNDVDMKKDSFD